MILGHDRLCSPLTHLVLVGPTPGHLAPASSLSCHAISTLWLTAPDVVDVNVDVDVPDIRKDADDDGFENESY